MAKNYNQNLRLQQFYTELRQIVGSEPGKPQRKQPLRFFRVFRKPAARSAYINICRNEVIV